MNEPDSQRIMSSTPAILQMLFFRVQLPDLFGEITLVLWMTPNVSWIEKFSTHQVKPDTLGEK